MERIKDTSEVQMAYRGGCGADSIENNNFIPGNIPEKAYVLSEGEKNNFPEDPSEIIPDNKKIRCTSIEQIFVELEEALNKFTEKIKKKENLELLKKVTGESKDMILEDLELVNKMGNISYYEGLMDIGGCDLSKYLENWQKSSGYEEKAVPLGRGVNINPGHNMSAVVIPEVWRALTKNSIFHKMPSGDQITMRLLDEVYQEQGGVLAETFKTGYWPGGSKELEKNLFSADFVMAWGGDQTIKSIKEKVSPTTRYIPFHFEFGAYLVDKDIQRNYNKNFLKNIAKDFSWGDQLLCFSPLVMAVESCDNTDEFLKDLAEIMEKYKDKYKMGIVPKNEKMKISRAKRIASNYDELVSEMKYDTTVVKKKGLDKNDLEEFHNFRYIESHVVDSLEEAITIFGENQHIQDFILATKEDKALNLRDKIAHTNAKRIVSPGGAPPQAPIPWDGKHPLNEMVKWISDERA